MELQTIINAAVALEPLQAPLMVAVVVGLFRLERRVLLLELKGRKPPPPKAPAVAEVP